MSNPFIIKYVYLLLYLYRVGKLSLTVWVWSSCIHPIQDTEPPGPDRLEHSTEVEGVRSLHFHFLYTL